MLGKNGYIWVIDQSRYMEYGGKTFLQGVVLDVTETVELRNKMKLLMKHMPESVYLLTYRKKCLYSQVLAKGLFSRWPIQSPHTELCLQPGSVKTRRETERKAWRSG